MSDSQIQNVENLHYKHTTVASYDRRLLEGGMPIGLDAYFRRRGRHEADIFLSGLKPESLILDLGCGIGLTSLYFWIQEFNVVSGDLGRVCLEMCQQRGVRNPVRMDQELLPFRAETFDGVWSHTALNHTPKAILKETLYRIGELVKPGGKFFICVKSNDEGERFHGKAGSEFYRVNFMEGEFEGFLPDGFELARYRVTRFGRIFLNFHLRKVPGYRGAI